MAPQVRSLLYLDVSNTSQIEYSNAYAILATLQQIELINFIPADIVNRMQDFKHLITIFHMVYFGLNVTRFLPFNAAHLQMNEI